MYVIEPIYCNSLLDQNLENKINLYLLTLDLVASIPQSFLDNLTKKETDKANSFVHHADKVRFVCTRNALRKLLAKLLNINSVSEVPVIMDANGKPRLNGNQSLYFNISHSGDKAMIVISNNFEVGVDIESKNHFSKKTEDIKDYVYSEDEKAQNPYITLEDFYTKWVVKESIVKASGYGLFHDLSSFSVKKNLNHIDDCQPHKINYQKSQYINIENSKEQIKKNKTINIVTHYQTENIPNSWNIVDIFSYETESYIAAITLIKAK